MNYQEVAKTLPTAELKTRIKSTGSKQFKEAMEAELKTRVEAPEKPVEDVIESTATVVPDTEKDAENVSEEAVEVVEEKPKTTRKQSPRKSSPRKAASKDVE
jgi:hypothetical protein